MEIFMDLRLQILMERIKSVTGSGKEDDFWELYKDEYNYVKYKAKKNKNKYFCIQRTIILLGAVVSTINIIITLVSIKEEWTHVVPYLSCIASIIAIISSSLIKLRDFKKYFETWNRHALNQSKLDLEQDAYLLGLNEYSGLDDAKALKRFEERCYEIKKENYQKFFSNMSHFETDLNDEEKNSGNDSQ